MFHSEKTPRGDDRVPRWVVFALAMAAIAGASCAFILGLAAMLKWQEVLAAVVATAGIAGGTLFTVLEMQRLGKRGS